MNKDTNIDVYRYQNNQVIIRYTYLHQLHFGSGDVLGLYMSGSEKCVLRYAAPHAAAAATRGWPVDGQPTRFD